MTALLPFNAHPTCPKCKTPFRLYGTPPSCFWQPETKALPECLLLRCPGCKFEQVMATADNLEVPE